MDYFFKVKDKNPIPRTHPLLLSLTRAINESDVSPNLASVSENDPDILNNKYYTSPHNLPPLGEHAYGTSPLSEQ